MTRIADSKHRECRRRWPLLLLASTAVACDGLPSVESWVRIRDPQPIQHASLPLAATFGGPVLSSPRVVPIFFVGDSLQNDVERFLSTLSRSTYWSMTTGEYGVGKLSVGSSFVVDEPPPATPDEADIEPWLARHLDGSDAAWPAPSARDIYVVFYPEIAMPDATGPVCTGTAYHYEGFRGVVGAPGKKDAGSTSAVDAGRGPSFIYAVVSECSTAEHASRLDDVTWSLSHELIEASTDPFIITDPAFQWPARGQLAWSSFYASGDSLYAIGEVADLCNLEAGPDAIALRVAGEFEVQRSWSNAAAREQQDPCVPATGDIYFGAAPDLTETVQVRLSDSKRFDTNGVRVPLHQSRNVDVRLFSVRPRPDFHVFAEELPLTEGDPPTLKFAWDRQTGNDHEFLHLTITRLRNGPLGGTQIRIASGEKGDASWTHGWMGFIAN